jgi:membrane associated rhomboid family serine protease
VSELSVDIESESPVSLGSGGLPEVDSEAVFIDRLSRIPWTTVALLTLCVAFFGFVYGIAGGVSERVVLWSLVGGAKVNSLILRGEWWRLISSSFLHRSAVHLLVNAMGILLLGWFVENSYGRRVLGTAFILSAFGGGLLSLWMTDSASVGGSGVMFGLLGMTIAFAIFHWTQIPRIVRLYVVVLPAVVGCVSIIHGITVPNVDNSAHIGGLVVGLLLGLTMQIMELRFPRIRDGMDYLMLVVVSLAAVYAVGAMVSHLMLRFDLPQERFATRSIGGELAFLAPVDWDVGVYREGTCMVGETVSHSLDIACFIDPYFTMILAGRQQRMVSTGAYTEFQQRIHGYPPELYAEHEITWAEDEVRGAAFALLAFRPLTERYLSLFGAVRAQPVQADNRSESP